MKLASDFFLSRSSPVSSGELSFSLDTRTAEITFYPWRLKAINRRPERTRATWFRFEGVPSCEACLWRAVSRLSTAVISGTETQPWRLALVSEFEDVNGHVFRKTGARRLGLSFDNRKIRKHEVVYPASPFTSENPSRTHRWRVFHQGWGSSMVTRLATGVCSPRLIA
jgi:hypothetical protein